MKQLNITFLLTMLMSMIEIQAFAHDIEVANADGVTIYYNYINDNTELEVTYRGSSYDSYSNEYSSEVVIPETVNYNGTTYSVTSIGSYAFRGSIDLISVEIPKSIISIGNEAFYSCFRLTSLIVSNDNPKYDSRGNCNAIIETATNKLILGCKNTIIPNTVTIIGYYAFSGCNGLTSIVIPNSVTNIEDNAFQYCRGLVYVTIGENVESIGAFAFEFCDKLYSLTIPNRVTSIGSKAFYGCSILYNISIGEGVGSIGNEAFSECRSLESITVNGGNTEYDSRGNCNAIIETATNKLILGCANSTIPEGVTEIGNNAFRGCRNLQSVHFPNSLKKVGEFAFEGCTGITSVHTSSLETWCDIEYNNYYSNPLYYGHYLFINGDKIMELNIPANIVKLKSYAFSGGYFTTVNTEDNLASWAWGNGIFRGSHIDRLKIYFYTIPQSCFSEATIGYLEIVRPHTAGDYSFSGAEIGEVVIPYSETPLNYSYGKVDTGLFDNCIIRKVIVDRYIKPYNGYYNGTRGTFFECTIDTMIVKPNAINYSGDRLYQGCKINNLYFDGVTEINSYAYFYNNGFYRNDIEHLHLSEGLITIKNDAFNNTGGSTYWFTNNLVLPQTLQNIENGAFYGVLEKGLSVTSLAATPPTIVDGTFSSDTYNSSLFVPAGSKDLYNAATGWKNFSKIYELDHLGDAIVFEDPHVKQSCITKWDINNNGELEVGEAASVNSIYYYCFHGGTTDLSFNSTLTTRFNEFKYFTGVTVLNSYSFSNYTELQSIILPNSITYIGDYAFAGTNLTSINIPSDVTEIGNHVCYRCNSLISVIADPINPISIDSNTFSNRANATLYVPKGSKAAYEAADYWKDFKEIIEVSRIGDPTANTLQLPHVEGYKGKQVELPISLNNQHDITAFQFDLYLPNGVSVAKKSNGKMMIETTERMEGTYSISSNTIDNFVRVTGYSAEGDAFTGNSGDILNITLDISDAVADGDYTISIKDIVLSDVNNTEYHPANVEGTLTVKSYTLGDVDNSGAVNINDVVCIINHILNKPVSVFIEEAADVDGSGSININDVVTLINRFILMKTGAPALMESQAPQLAVADDNYLHLATIDIKPGETLEIPMLMTNANTVAAIQGNIKLPEGLTFATKSNGRLDVKNNDSRAEDFTLSCGLQSDGSLTFAQYSADGFTYEGSEGTIFTFKIQAAEDVTPGTYNIVLSNVVLSIDGVGYEYPESTSTLNITGTDGISNIMGISEHETYHTLDGREVKNPGKGIYIVNGKKVMIK